MKTHRKILGNEDGVVIIAALMILALLTIIGVAGLSMSITESQISTNNLVHHMEFYGADSGVDAIGPLWCNENILPIDSVDFDADEPLPQQSGTFSNLVSWTADMEYVDPVNNYEYISNMPDMRITGEGTHPRGGIVRLERIYVYASLFEIPEAALRVNSSVDGNGNAGSIIGTGTAGSECADVPSIMYDVALGTIDYTGEWDGNPVQSDGMYNLPLFEENIRRKADISLAPDTDGKVMPDDVITSEDDPGIVVIDGNTKINNLSGWGVLYVDGTLELAGNLDWHGIIITSDNLVLSGGGNKTIYGAVVSMGDAMAINGGVDIQYDCELLQSLYDKHTGYRPTRSWRYI